MIELLKSFPLIFLFVTHPFDQIPLGKILPPQSPFIFTQGAEYYAPGDGEVKSIQENNGIYQVTLSLDDGYEVVYSGLTEIMKGAEERIVKNEPIGMDSSITSDTKIILMFYEYSNLFSQFVNNELTFLIDKGNTVYAIANGTINEQGYDQNGAGLFIKVTNSLANISIIYSHLQVFMKQLGNVVIRGDSLAMSGNTGSSESPRLVLRFEDEELDNNFKVIYIRGIRSY